jgi:16S rRNA processing protein RimM
MELIAVGRITKPVGTIGEMNVLPFSDVHGRFAELKSVWVGFGESGAKRCEIVTTRIDTKRIIIGLRNIETVDAAKKLCGQYVFVSKENAAHPRKGSYFIDDIIGCEVLTEEQKAVGVVKDVFSLPANDLWSVWNGEKEMLIPAVQAIVKRVDTRNKRIIIHAVEGLID